MHSTQLKISTCLLSCQLQNPWKPDGTPSKKWEQLNLNFRPRTTAASLSRKPYNQPNRHKLTINLRLPTANLAEKITSTFDTLAPMTTSIIPRKHKPWVLPQLRSLMRKRDKTYKKSKGSNNPELVDIFKDLRSRVSNALDTAKNQFLSSQMSTAKSLKVRWNTLKKIRTTESALLSPFNYFTPNDLNLHFASTINRYPPVP